MTQRQQKIRLDPQPDFLLLFLPPFKPAEKWCPDWGELSGVSDGLGGTNACTGMYRLAFIAKHGMHSYKDNSGSPVPGARGNRPQYGHHFSDEGLVRGGIFSSLFVAVDKKGLAHLLINNYGVWKASVCEILFRYKSLQR